MRLLRAARALRGGVAALSLLFVAPAGVASCTDAGASRPPTVDDACPRSTYLFCRCEGDVPGTKLCRADGSGFEACVCGKTACEPGEAVSCGCEGDTVGAALCDEEGVLSACACAAPENAGPSEACPGKALAVPRSATVKIAGNTSRARPDRAAECGGEGPDQVFQLVPGGSGRLLVEVRGIAPLDAVVYVTAAPCGNAVFQCVDNAPPGGTEQIELSVSAGAPIFAFVDSFDVGGSFVLSATLFPDGPEGDVCPGPELTLSAAVPLTVDGTTVGFGDDGAGPGLCAAGKTAPDVFYTVKAAQEGTLRARVDPAGQATALLSATSGCDPAASRGCARAAEGAVGSLSIPLAKGESVTLAVDGTTPQGFAFSLELFLE